MGALPTTETMPPGLRAAIGRLVDKIHGNAASGLIDREMLRLADEIARALQTPGIITGPTAPTMETDHAE